MKREIWFDKKVALLLLLALLLTPSITFANSASKSLPQKRTTTPKRNFPLKNFIFETDTPLAVLIRAIADMERINVIYEDSIAKLVETKRVTFVAKDVTTPRALEMVLNSQRLGFAPIDKRTIIVFPEALANKQRFQDMVVKTLYLKYSNLDDVRNAILTAIGIKHLILIKPLGAMVIRDTEENIKLVEALLPRIDKPHSEFVFEVGVYEVNDQTASQLGNQFGTISANEISQLQNKGSMKLLGSTRLHAFEDEAASLNMGKRVAIPVKTRRTVANTASNSEQQSGQNSDNAGNKPTAVEEQVQYVDIGLNMELAPVTYDENVLLKMSLDLTGATNTAPNPEFSQHRVKEFLSIKKDETKIVANTFSLGSSFFASAGGKISNTNVIITITPHIVREPEVTPQDRSIIGANGTATVYDVGITIEEMLIRAEQDDAVSK